MNAFTATVNPTDGIVEDVDEEEELVESKFEKMDDQDDIHTAYEKLYKVSKKHEKLYRLATKKLSDVELDREELSTKFDEANQTIGALRFENNNVKTNLASEKLDKGKSILGAPFKLEKKMLKTLRLRRRPLKSLNKRSSISVIIVVLPVILDQITISG